MIHISKTNANKTRITQYASPATRNMLRSGGFDVDAYHSPSPDNAVISELMLMLMGAIEVPDEISESIPIEIKMAGE